MNSITQIKMRLLWALALIACLAVSGASLMYFLSPLHGLPYHDAFRLNEGSGWDAFGGAWEITNGIMRNSSDERGAKLVTGSARWRNYTMQADLRLLSQGGDVGLVVRANDEERGVDAYNGYYVGLRSGDDSLIIGRADYGWMEGQPTPVPGGVRAFDWYHLKIVAVGCTIGALAQNLQTSKTAYAALQERSCVRSGRIGLRSLATGGEWRNIRVSAATRGDLSGILHYVKHITSPIFPQDEATYNATHSFPTYDHNHTGLSLHATIARRDRTPISTLASLKLADSAGVRVRGVVTRTSPGVYIQDATGGAAVLACEAPFLNLGDEVEVTGQSEPLGYATEIRDATITLLWDRAPVPPVSVTATQAATGAFASMLVETHGVLEKKEYRANEVVLNLEDGEQSFLAVCRGGRRNSLLKRLSVHSRLRLRGICVLDPRYTGRLTPFALLLRSADDVDIVAGPPWWTKSHLIEIGLAIVLLALGAYIIYNRIELWRLRGIAEERERLAYNLHDTLAQSFAGVSFQLQGIRSRLRTATPSSLEVANSQLEMACDIVRRTHEEASLNIAMLRWDSSEVGDLAAALERWASKMFFEGNISIDVHSGGQIRLLPVRVTKALFQIGREAIVNAVRHADPSQINVLINYESRRVTMVVEDNGTGFRGTEAYESLGMHGMETRARGIDALLSVESRLGKGSRVEVTAALGDRNDRKSYFAHFWRSTKNGSLASTRRNDL